MTKRAYTHDICLTGFELVNAYLDAARSQRESRNWPEWLEAHYQLVFGVPKPPDMSATWAHTLIGAELQFLIHQLLNLPQKEAFLEKREALLSGDEERLDIHSKIMFHISETHTQERQEKNMSKEKERVANPEKESRGPSARKEVEKLLRVNNKAKLSDEQIYAEVSEIAPGIMNWPFMRISHVRQTLNREEFQDDPILNFECGEPVKVRSRGMAPDGKAQGADVIKFSQGIAVPIPAAKSKKPTKPTKIETEVVREEVDTPAPASDVSPPKKKKKKKH